MWGRKVQKPTRKKSRAEELVDALKEEAAQQDRKARERERARRLLFWWRNAPGWVRTGVWGVLVVLLLLVADGIRRENKEFRATLVSLNGQAQVQKRGQSSATDAAANMTLADKDVVTTGTNSTATIVFPDGSAIQLEPATQFEVRLLDFARGGVRDRSFMVRFGAAIANVSQFFGAESQATVCTPNAVAAVRGTGFRVAYNPDTKQTLLQVANGSVQFRTPTGETPSQAGQMVTASGYQLGAAQGLPQPAQTAVSTQVNQMTTYDRPPNIIERIENWVNNLLDPLLQLVGLSPGGWGYATGNAARRAACAEALRRLRIHIESLAEAEAPDVINPVTLAELQLDPRERDKVLSGFMGNMLLSYRKLGKNSYLVEVRARDKAHTLYQMDMAEIKQVKE